jgi:hypothetical protein
MTTVTPQSPVVSLAGSVRATRRPHAFHRYALWLSSLCSLRHAYGAAIHSQASVPVTLHAHGPVMRNQADYRRRFALPSGITHLA